MTYEHLIKSVAALSRELSGNAVKLLWYLISECIHSGGNELRLSTTDLSRALDMHRTTVAGAAAALDAVIVIKTVDGIGYTFLLPNGWFDDSNGRFPTNEPVENLIRLSEKPTPTCREYRQPPVGNTDSPEEAIRRPFALPVGKTDSYLSEIPPGDTTSCRKNRQVETENQQLTEDAPSRSRSESVCDRSIEVDQIYQIAQARKIPDHLVDASSVLSEHMRAYARDHGSPHLTFVKPNELLLARSFAIAPLGDLLSLLRALHADGTRAGRTHAWFVNTFAQRIHGIPADALNAAFELHKAKPAEKPQQRLEFAQDLLSDAAGKMRKLG